MQCTQRIFGNLPANNLKHYMNLNIAMLLPLGTYAWFLVYVEIFISIDKLCLYYI